MDLFLGPTIRDNLVSDCEWRRSDQIEVDPETNRVPGALVWNLLCFDGEMRLKRIEEQAGRRLRHFALARSTGNGIEGIKAGLRHYWLVTGALGRVFSEGDLLAVISTVGERINGGKLPSDLV